MSWLEFPHEAMATHFAILIDGQERDYAGQAARAAFREIDRLENELSQFIESSDIARANQLRRGESAPIGPDALECLIMAADVSLATRRAFDAGYRSTRHAALPADAPPYTLDPAAHTITSVVDKLHLDLGAIGKGYALDRAAETLRDWGIASACLNAGGSTVLALAPPAADARPSTPLRAGWPIGIGEGATHRALVLTDLALSGSGIAVQGAHLIDPRTGRPAPRTNRTWAAAPSAALSDALSTAFFVMNEADIAAFCAAHPSIGAALSAPGDEWIVHGTLRAVFERSAAT